MARQSPARHPQDAPGKAIARRSPSWPSVIADSRIPGRLRLRHLGLSHRLCDRRRSPARTPQRRDFRARADGGALGRAGQLLKGAPNLGKYDYDGVIALAKRAKSEDPFGYRAESVNLARLAKAARP